MYCENFRIFVYFVVDENKNMSPELTVEQNREAGRDSVNCYSKKEISPPRARRTQREVRLK